MFGMVSCAIVRYLWVLECSAGAHCISCTCRLALKRLCVHLQTSIITEGFRSLAEGEQVEFYVESGDDGRTKAVQVTGPGGAPPQVKSAPDPRVCSPVALPSTCGCACWDGQGMSRVCRQVGFPIFGRRVSGIVRIVSSVSAPSSSTSSGVRVSV